MRRRILNRYGTRICVFLARDSRIILELIHNSSLRTILVVPTSCHSPLLSSLIFPISPHASLTPRSHIGTLLARAPLPPPEYLKFEKIASNELGYLVITKRRRITHQESDCIVRPHALYRRPYAIHPSSLSPSRSSFSILRCLSTTLTPSGAHSRQLDSTAHVPS